MVLLILLYARMAEEERVIPEVSHQGYYRSIGVNMDIEKTLDKPMGDGTPSLSKQASKQASRAGCIVCLSSLGHSRMSLKS